VAGDGKSNGKETTCAPGIDRAAACAPVPAEIGASPTLMLEGASTQKASLAAISTKGGTVV